MTIYARNSPASSSLRMTRHPEMTLVDDVSDDGRPAPIRLLSDFTSNPDRISDLEGKSGSSHEAATEGSTPRRARRTQCHGSYSSCQEPSFS
jgi:hypothetical protein